MLHIIGKVYIITHYFEFNSVLLQGQNFNPCEMDVWPTFVHVTKVEAWELFSSKVGPLDENKG